MQDHSDSAFTLVIYGSFYELPGNVSSPDKTERLITVKRSKRLMETTVEERTRRWRWEVTAEPGPLAAVVQVVDKSLRSDPPGRTKGRITTRSWTEDMSLWLCSIHSPPLLRKYDSSFTEQLSALVLTSWFCYTHIYTLRLSDEIQRAESPQRRRCVCSFTLSKGCGTSPHRVILGPVYTKTFCFVFRPFTVQTATFWKQPPCTRERRKHQTRCSTFARPVVVDMVWWWTKTCACLETVFWGRTKKKKKKVQQKTIDRNVSAHASFQNIAFSPFTWKKRQGRFQIFQILNQNLFILFHFFLFYFNLCYTSKCTALWSTWFYLNVHYK